MTDFLPPDREIVDGVTGFLSEDEGRYLYDYAWTVSALGPCLEVGSYCGKSSMYIGAACQKTGNKLFAVDPHRGSEENQPGQEYHDARFWNQQAQLMDTLPTFRQNIAEAGLEDVIVPIVATSKTVADYWHCPLGLIFIDAAHSYADVALDLALWLPKLASGGALIMHDLYPDPDTGGQFCFSPNITSQKVAR